MTTLSRLFTEHPEKVDETYFEHMRFAAGFGGTLLRAGAAALIHAIFPFACETTASRAVKRLHARISGRGDEAPGTADGARDAAAARS